MSDPPHQTPPEGPTAASDRSLLARFRHGEEDASTALYLRYARRLHALATAKSSADLRGRAEPEDIVQSVFRTFFRRAAQGHYEAPDGGDLWKLLLVIALNKIRAAAIHHRAAKRDVRRTLGTGGDEGRAEQVPAAHDDLALATLRMVIDEALRRLPESHRPIVELRIEGYEVAEIAEKIGRSKRTVERVLQDFRAGLGARMRGGDRDE